MALDVRQLYLDCGALLEGHFLLSSGNHSQFYLQSAKVLENPQKAQMLTEALAQKIHHAGLTIDCVCSPALGGILAGYELARALGVRFIFSERVNSQMVLRRGFVIRPQEKVLICEDIITTGGSALEAGQCVQEQGAQVVGFASLANRGICPVSTTHNNACKLPPNLPFFTLENFDFEMFAPENCPLCAFSAPIKPGSRGN
ncbi:orotate phosphoribosyltransferase [Helicobacter bizzozeronii CIII-1]|uniref:Orotate phosphoribosyltransferase n=1 Tax=Helicobacter bizzozeronii (strain CIII-1) TaxID=1002804 RepID=F8KQL1_HELBC|nr:orotate phosphoribosyltransferase [Helicobacter bizzozeronii]CCB79015.1 orotate phosphoribosyltransferase [Helicobacter bizzozeronii CIII-1]